jgi:hypothetical protein
MAMAVLPPERKFGKVCSFKSYILHNCYLVFAFNSPNALEEVCLSQWLHDLDTSCYVEDL